MVRVAQDRLGSAARHATLGSESDYSLLIKPAINKADRVFLWLHLALSHLLQGIGSVYSVSQLSNILHSIPGDIPVIFQKILDKLLDRPDRFRVAIMLLYLSDRTLSLGDRRHLVYFAAIDNVLDRSIGPDDLVQDSLGERYSPSRMERRLTITKARLRGRYEDFIDIRESPGQASIPSLL